MADRCGYTRIGEPFGHHDTCLQTVIRDTTIYSGPVDTRHYSFYQLNAHVNRNRGGFTCGAHRNDAGSALTDMPVQEPLETLIINGAIGCHGGHQGYQAASNHAVGSKEKLSRF